MTKPPYPRALLFDWDNTLVNTWPAIHDAINHTLVAMGHEAWTYAQTRQRVRKSMRESFPGLFGERWKEAGEIFYARFEESHIQQLEPCEDAEILLKSLIEKDFYLAVVSNKTGKYLREEVEHLGWGKYFKKIVGAGDAAQDKPDPAPVDLALAGSWIERSGDVWFVGDTDVDMECAHKCACSAILIRSEPPREGEFDAYPTSCYFNSCKELLIALDQKNDWEKAQKVATL